MVHPARTEEMQIDARFSFGQCRVTEHFRFLGTKGSIRKRISENECKKILIFNTEKNHLVPLVLEIPWPHEKLPGCVPSRVRFHFSTFLETLPREM